MTPTLIMLNLGISILGSLIAAVILMVLERHQQP